VQEKSILTGTKQIIEHLHFLRNSQLVINGLLARMEIVHNIIRQTI